MKMEFYTVLPIKYFLTVQVKLHAESMMKLLVSQLKLILSVYRYIFEFKVKINFLVLSTIC